MEVNKNQRIIFFDKIKKYYDNLEGKVFAIWGLAFKDNTDDMRESPALDIIPLLLQNGAKVKAYDPIAIDNAKNMLPEDVEYGNNRYDVLKGVDALIILTDWKEFIEIDFDIIKENVKDSVVFDGRNMYDREEVENHGIKYFGMGI